MVKFFASKVPPQGPEGNMPAQNNQLQDFQTMLKEAESEPGLQDAIELYRRVNELVQANNDMIFQSQVVVPSVVSSQLSPMR
jgi:hypothetical protein